MLIITLLYIAYRFVTNFQFKFNIGQLADSAKRFDNDIIIST